MATQEMVVVAGNTYPVRDKLKELGGVLKKENDKWVWYVPKDKEEEAKKLVAGAPKQEMSKSDRIAAAARKRGGKPGTCSSCGRGCKYPYTECWDCKEERDMGY